MRTVRETAELCPCLLWHGFGVAKERLVTQSCSLLSVAHTLTHHGWNTHHDQHAAGGSQSKLLTKVSLWSDMGHATTVRWVGWSRMSSKVIQHAGKLKLPQTHCMRNSTNPLKHVHGQTQSQCQLFYSQKRSWTFFCHHDKMYMSLITKITKIGFKESDIFCCVLTTWVMTLQFICSVGHHSFRFL